MTQHRSRCTVLLLVALAIGLPGWAEAAQIDIDDANDLELGVGDYAAVAGYDGSNPAVGQRLDVLSVNVGDNGNLVTNSLDMGLLRQTLASGGVTETSTLVFGLEVDEFPFLGLDDVNVETLSMNFERVGGGTDTFTLAGDNIRVQDYNSGATADARIQVNLGFDFMTEYTNASTEAFTISATISSMHQFIFGDDEVFFLSSGFTDDPPAPEEPIPEPGTFVLLGVVMIAAVFARRKWGKRKPGPDLEEDVVEVERITSAENGESPGT